MKIVGFLISCLVIYVIYIKFIKRKYEEIKISFEQFEKFYILAPDKYKLEKKCVIFEDKFKLVFANSREFNKYYRFYRRYLKDLEELKLKNKKMKDDVLIAKYLKDVQSDINDLKLKSDKELEEAKEVYKY